MDDTKEIYNRATVQQADIVEKAQQPTGLLDRFFGNKVSGQIESNYEYGSGARIRTTIKSGRAALEQSWQFDARGRLTGVSVIKIYDNQKAAETVIGRDPNNTFSDKLTVFKDEATTQLPTWEQEFNKAAQRLDKRMENRVKGHRATKP